MSNDDLVRKQLVALLEGGQAHATIDDVLNDFPAHGRGLKPHGLPHSAWELLEHLRIAQRDILDFSRDPGYVAPKWPDDYWPPTPTPPSDADWSMSIAQVQLDLEQMIELVADAKHDLYAPFAWGEGQNLLREAMLVADHNAWHLGQIALLKRLV